MKFFKLSFHIEGSSRSYSIRLPEFSRRVLAAGKALVCVGIALLLVTGGVRFSYDFLKDRMIGNRLSLSKRLDREASRLDSLNRVMEARFAGEDLLHYKFGLSPADRGSREMSIGGPESPERRLARLSQPVLDKSISLETKAEQFRAKALENERNFREIANFAGQQYSNWRHIPSISPTTGRYASAFGRRNHPVTGEIGRMHNGVDISNSRWTPIYATADGVVTIARRSESFGNYVALDHGNGFVTKYGHMQSISVKQGQLIKRYQLLGYMGNTGLSAGPHLHYEVWLNSRAENPLRYILPGEYAIQ
jgi:murein DD-endopeptidase MepM/ murein hydrolase activator NlpD